MTDLELILAYERRKKFQRFVFMARWHSIKYKYNRSLKLYKDNLMDMCEIDWGSLSTIIAALIASATAFCISNKWQGQKGQEVLATESRLLLYDLYELKEHMIFLVSDKLNRDVNFQDEINKFENRVSKIQKSLLFLSNELESNHHNEIKELWESLNLTNKELASYRSENDHENKTTALFKLNLTILEKENKNFWGDLDSLIDRVVKILRNKALYKKD